MKAHWTSRSLDDYRHSIIASFLMQLEKAMESKGISRKELAKRLHITPEDVSRVFDGHLEDFTLERVIEYAHALNLEVVIVSYEIQTTDTTRGPIHSSIFLKCWEALKRPQSWFDFDRTEKS